MMRNDEENEDWKVGGEYAPLPAPTGAKIQVKLTQAIPYDRANVSPGRVILYASSCCGGGGGGKGNANSLNNLKKNVANPNISPTAKKNIITSLSLFYALNPARMGFDDVNKKSVNYRLVFITLTLPAKQMHSDTDLKKLALNHWLVVMRKDYDLKHYLWRAEPQKNGNIHFHICANVWLKWQDVQNEWNKVLDKLGYIDLFAAKHGHRNPPTTDISTVLKVKKLRGYLAKYMAKNENNRAIEGRQWFQSESLSKLAPLRLPYEGQIAFEIDQLTAHQKAHFFSLERATVLFTELFGVDLRQYPAICKERDAYFAEYSALFN